MSFPSINANCHLFDLSASILRDLDRDQFDQDTFLTKTLHRRSIKPKHRRMCRVHHVLALLPYSVSSAVTPFLIIV